MSNGVDSSQSQDIHDEIEELEQRLKIARARLNKSGEPITTLPSKLIASDGKLASFSSHSFLTEKQALSQHHPITFSSSLPTLHCP
jgi:hypothetical protein